MESYGVLVGDEIISPMGLMKALKTPPPLSLDEVITLGKRGVDILEHLIHCSTKAEKKDSTISIEDITVLPPVPSPPKIVCLGLNYRDHAQEQGAEIPDEPVIFMSLALQ